ncbi:hypothetical protein [Nocardioides sp.]|uniref:hypothetical protein n=1 Tax=Nocardioides sp. TaxID=35761 RepID=UPI003784754F
MEPSLDETAVLRLLRRQAGVISRRQVLEHGGTDVDIERLLRRRVWAAAHAGVYVDHTGSLTWDQRAWAAVLRHAPAALTGRSALRAHRMRVSPAIAPDHEPIDVVVAAGRRVTPATGVRVTRSRDLSAISQPGARPPRVRLEHAVLVAASAAPTEDAAVAVLADACQEGRTTSQRLREALRRHPRMRRRRLLAAVLADVEDGALSALERRYLVRVERAHGLPRGTRQQRAVGTDGRSTYPDVRYAAQRTIVELDGRLAHDRAAKGWADIDRDLEAAAAGDITVRVAWGQVLVPCRLAAAVARVLAHRGWTGALRPCAAGCTAPESGGSPARGAGDPPSSD